MVVGVGSTKAGELVQKRLLFIYVLYIVCRLAVQSLMLGASYATWSVWYWSGSITRCKQHSIWQVRLTLERG